MTERLYNKMYDPEKAERKKEKRIAAIMLRSIGVAGVGAGLFLLRFLVAPFLGEDPEALAAIGAFSLCLIGYGGAMTFVFVFKRAWVPRAWLLMTWVVLPTVALKILLGKIW